MRPATRLGVSWVVIVALVVGGGATAQWALWGEPGQAWYRALLRWPVLWLVYVVGGLMIGERIHRWLWGYALRAERGGGAAEQHKENDE